MLAYRRYLVLFAICIGVSTLPMIFTATYTVLPTIGRTLSASVTELQWIINIYGVTICSGLVTSGRLADIYGRKRFYFIGMLFFIIGMLICGVANHIAWIIFSYALLGLCGAILIPVSQAIIAHVFPLEERSKAIGILMAFIGLAMAMGPLFGGLIVDFLSWRWLFLITIPLSIVSGILVAIYTPESSSGEAAPKVDWQGVLLLGIAISTFVIAVLQGNQWHRGIILILSAICIIAVSILFFVERKAKFPIVRVELFHDRLYFLASIANAALLGFFWAGLFALPLYLENLRHYSPGQTGLLTLFVTAPIAIFSFIAGQLYHRFGPRLLICYGFIFLFISAFLQMFFTLSTPFYLLMLATISFGLGVGFAWSPSISAAMLTLSKAHTGIGSGTFFTLQEMGGTVGLAITGTIIRSHPSLLIGYQRGMWVLVFICIIGFTSAIFMRQSKD